MKAKFTLIVVLVLAFLCGNAQTIRYVKPTAAGTGSGNSWANASADLQAMINASAANDQVWVAAGTYYPTSGTNRSISFVMKTGVKIYGDFPATGNPVFADRNLGLYETVLSGDIDRNDGPNFTNNSGNSYHVISNNSNGANSTALLDGFIITGGNANGTYPENSGGGILNISASPVLANVIFLANAASVNGGAMLNVSAAPTLTNAVFSGNNAGGQGGAIANSNGSPNIMHATFWDNNAGTAGGAMFSYTLSSPTIVNSILWGNTVAGTTVSNIGGDFAGAGSCIVEGGYPPGFNIINQNPLFSNSASPAGADNKWGTADDGLTLLPCSPGVNTGNNAGVSGNDMIGNPRIFNTTTDRGAYEYQGNAVSGTATRLYVDSAITVSGNGTSWASAYQDLQTALAAARLCTNITEIWVAKGTYKPTAGTDRSISFVMVNNVAIYGSFAGNETALADRTAAVMAANPTILSGDIDGVPDVVTGTGSTLSITGNAGNSYHVVICGNGNFNTRLDGFTVSGGNANVTGTGNVNGKGGGMLSYNNSTRIVNVTFTGNNAVNGGGLYNESCSAVLTNVSFLHNKAGDGGGLYDDDFDNVSPSSIFNSVTFTGNLAQFGGGCFNYYAIPTFNNCTFSGNHATNRGGGIMMLGGVILNNSLVTANTAFNGGGVYINSASFYATNSFFVGNGSTNGGALYLDYTTAAYLTNVVVAGNSANNPTGGTATGKGGGVYMGDVSNLYCKFVDFYKNTATNDGGGIYFSTAYEQKYDLCIFWGNRKGTAISNIGFGTNDMPHMYNCVVEGGDSTRGYAFNAYNSSEYPRFVNPDNVAGNDGIYGTADDGLTLGECSPAIDNLTTSQLYHSVHTDILGNTRYFHNKYDVGAYENLTSPAITLPTVYTEKTQDIATDSVFMDNGCKIMAKVTPTPGPNALAGNVEIKEWIEANTFNMVRRHYQITPASNAGTAQGRVTLYFTPADFQAYNANGNIPLPTQDNSTPLYAANIEVVKYSGTSPNGLPGGYPAQTPVILTGSALKLWWEGAYYSITFDVTGFSGFFVKTSSQTIPLTLLSFEGKATATGNLLNWKTEREVNFSHFEIERSTDARQFEKIGTQASNPSGNYALLDVSAYATAQYYYRLKMVDRDGKYTYSKTIRINNTGKAIVGQPYPNPTAGMATVEVSTVENADWTFSVTDVMGRVLQTFTKSLSKGTHAIRFDKLPQGVSYIKIESGNVHAIRKLIRQ